MVQQKRVDRVTGQSFQVAIRLKRDGFDETFRGKPAAVIRGLVAVELNQVHGAKGCDLHYLSGVLIHENANPDNTLR